MIKKIGLSREYEGWHKSIQYYPKGMQYYLISYYPKGIQYYVISVFEITKINLKNTKCNRIHKAITNYALNFNL